jgi:hypothetical protein
MVFHVFAKERGIGNMIVDFGLILQFRRIEELKN